MTHRRPSLDRRERARPRRAGAHRITAAIDLDVATIADLNAAFPAGRTLTSDTQ